MPMLNSSGMHLSQPENLLHVAKWRYFSAEAEGTQARQSWDQKVDPWHYKQVVWREIQSDPGFADQHDMRNFFQTTIAIFEPISNDHTPLRSQEGTLQKGDIAIQQRCKEYFEHFLSRESMVTDETIRSIPKPQREHP